MPTNNNQNQQNGNQAGVVNDGDVLAQLAANQATTKDIYLVQKSIDNTAKKIEKHQQKSNTVLTDINKLLKQQNRVMTSVDSNFNQVLTELRRISTGTSGIPYNSGSTSDTSSNYDARLDRIISLLETQTDQLSDVSSYVNDCSSYLDEMRELLRDIESHNVAAATTVVNDDDDDATKADSFADINDTLISILKGVTHIAAQVDTMLNNPWHPESTAGTRRHSWDTDTDDYDDDESEDRPNLDDDTQKLFKNLFDDVFNDLPVSLGAIKDITGALMKHGSGEFITKDVVSGVGSAVGDIAGGAVATAINAAVPGLGTLIGNVIDHAVTKAFKDLGDWLAYFAEHATKTRNDLIDAALQKIRSDVKAMSTYSIEIQQSAVEKIYAAWDQNMSAINATQGYTKEALNTLQDSVAQRLQREGYGNVINAADYVTQLSNTLNAKLGGELAEAFAAQNLILQKVVPEIDLSSMSADFAAIYTNAQKQGMSGETEMISAMNQIAGAVKALEQVTEGNNQFITQTGAFLKKAEEVVNRSGGTADQIASLTTQMMAAEAPLAALVPQLSGFTNTIVDTLTKGNDATAVALRSIMHDINSNIGISATDFMQSFVEDTQGTLATAYAAIDQFINSNSNAGARQEFYGAMESVFGLQANQIAQIDFRQIADEVARASTATNIQELVKAENLVKSGETTTFEDQLIANTSNQLLATNAVRDTIDNRLMRKLEQNEFTLEKAVYELEATQTVDFADKTLKFFTNLVDVIASVIDPFGLFRGLTTIADVVTSSYIDDAMYATTAVASQVGSAAVSKIDEAAADRRTEANQQKTAENVAYAALLTNSAYAAQKVVQHDGISDTFKEMFKEATASSVAESKQPSEMSDLTKNNVLNDIEEKRRQQREAEMRKAETDQNQKDFDRKRDAAIQAQQAMLNAERAVASENHDNIAAIRESVSKLDELSNYLSPILDENRNQSNLLQSLAEKVDKLVLAVTNKATQSAPTSVVPNVNTSYNERNRIYGPVKTW